MGEAITAARYYCHLCAQRVTPITEPDPECPNCGTGFVEEIQEDENFDSAPSNLRSERALSLWAPVLLGMMGNNGLDPISDSARFPRGPVRRERGLEDEVEEEVVEEEEVEEEGSDFDENEDEIDREIEDIFRRSRRRSAILQLLESLREDMRADSEREERERDGQSLILMNASSNQAIIIPSILDSDETSSEFGTGSGLIGDYFLGPGLDLLLQHLAENDPTRYGTPPAKKEAVEALPSVKIMEELSCSVCLEDFEIGAEAKEIPCKHKYHVNCILPWLEMHSSCPVCRYQLPAEERKENVWTGGDTGDDGTGGNAGIGDNNNNSFFSANPS